MADTLASELDAAIASGEIFGPEEEAPLLEIPAAAFREAILSSPHRTDGGRRLRLRRARIDGALDMEAQQIGMRLQLNDCELTGTINLRQAQVTDVALIDCLLKGGLYANQIESRWNLRLDDSKVSQGVSLVGAKIGGQLSMKRATLKGAAQEGGGRRSALNADRIGVDGGIFCDEMTSEGEVRLLGAKVDGQVSASKATLKCSTRNGESTPSLSADRAVVTGGVFFRSMTSEGEIRLVDAQVAGPTSMTWAKLKGKAQDGKEPKPAFNAGRAELNGGIFCEGMTSEGEVRLLGAKVGGQLSMKKTKLKGLTGTDGRTESAFGADRAEVKGDAFFRGMSSHGEVRLPGIDVRGQLDLAGVRLLASDPSEDCLTLTAATIDELILVFREVVGIVDLTDAKARSLWDAEGGEFRGEIPETLLLQGFRYESLREPLSAGQRLEWIERSQREQHYPGVYSELANAYRRIGRRSDAREVGIANERRAREDGSPLKKAWSYLLWKSVRYGYENWRAAVGLLVVIALGSLLFCLANDRFVTTAKDPPGLSPVIYAIDTALPVLDLGQTSAWATTGWLEWIELGLAASGYALVAAVIAGLAGIFNRDQV